MTTPYRLFPLASSLFSLAMLSCGQAAAPSTASSTQQELPTYPQGVAANPVETPETKFNTPPARLSDVRLGGVPHVFQKPDFCGEACVSMALQWMGHRVDQDEVFARSGVNPVLGRGAWTPELKVAMESLGFQPGAVWKPVRPAHAAEDLAAELSELHADLQKGIPSIVCMHYNESPTTTEHFRLIVGYDSARDELIYHEPAEREGAYRRMPRARFLSLWPLKYRPDTWLAIRLRLSSQNPALAKAYPRQGFSPADYAQHIMEVKAKLSRLSGAYTILVEPPFVVIGDGPEPQVRAHAAKTVRWATERLKASYFSKDPVRILDVWLFSTASGYRRNASLLFGDTPDTPYGFYSSEHRALVMNISTGGGTLVHEIVHPFIEANVPGCPPWLNEGLGSLYEQSGEENGRIHGYTNWRLAGLQGAIRRNNVPPIEALMAMDGPAFYADDSGVHYASARYLLYYLQQQNKLLDYYHAYIKNRAGDPSGYQTLKSILNESDMAAFQKRWERYVLTLHFP